MRDFSTLHRRAGHLYRALRYWRTVPRFGFVQGHSHLTQDELDGLSRSLGELLPDTVVEFEKRYASLIGEGDAVAFATGRMGFFALMQELGIGEGDEVVLPGATCSVMSNAVLRVGAQPVYADIDAETFAPDAASIERALSPKTRMIVAQHSFGIPCDIRPIAELAQAHRLFLLEDCALTLGSTIGGRVAGSFGHAALFSTDHSKPLNTMTGGLIYSANSDLIAGLRQRQAAAGELSRAKQGALYQRLLLERTYCQPGRYGRLALRELGGRLSGRSHPFLDEDFGAGCGNSYPYPARIPGFLSALGLLELKRWPDVASERKRMLATLLQEAGRLGLGAMLPNTYRDPERDIVPLRLAWHAADGARQRWRLEGMVDVSWTWFMQPIVAAGDSLDKFGYRTGMCPVSEVVGAGMVNLPCNVDSVWLPGLLHCLQRIGETTG